jgi:hypothetical protein
VGALQLAGEKLQADAGGAQLFGQGDGLVELGPGGGAGGDRLGEDAGDAGGLECVELGVEGLAEGGGAGVADPHVPRRFGTGRGGAGQLDPERARLANGRGGHGERLGERGHEPEAGGVVLDGHLAQGEPAGAAQEGIGQAWASTRR